MKERTFLHVDMDAFFAAVEQRERPELRGKPVIIGAPPDARGVVSTCSYEARVFGVHSAMPSREAYRRCPQGVFLPPRGHLYQEVSTTIFGIFDRFSPFVEPLSIDEAFIDISGSQHLFGGPVETARRLQQAIVDETQLTGSVGVAPNKFLAKVGSDLHKPNGLTIVPRQPAAIQEFLAPLPVRRIWGVGAKTAEVLALAGLQTIGHLQRLGLRDLQRLLGNAAGSHIHELAHGRDDREIALDTADKSISHEYTFDEDERDWREVEQVLVWLAEKVGFRLRAQRLAAHTVQLKLRWAPFRTITRQRQVSPAVTSDRELIVLAGELLARERARQAVRLVGFGVSGLVADDGTEPYQPDLFTDADGSERERNEKLDRAVDQVRRQFGQDSLRRGR